MAQPTLRSLRTWIALGILLAGTRCALAPHAGTPDAAAGAATSKPEAWTPVTEVDGIAEYRLPNGLKILLFPDATLSTVTVSATYRVGSRHEGPGEGGMAHLLEHMVFKGTPNFPNLQTALSERGAQWNGTTSSDRTNYFETLAATDENLDFALRLEAERMVQSAIRAEDLATEMTVVRNEFESGENSPGAVLQQRMLATAYLFHSYGRPTIGNQSDIERVPVERLRAFYQKYYQPDNAMLVVAGRFDRERALQRIRAYFGAIPRPARTLEQTYTVEPPQDGPRTVVLSRVGSVASTGLLYHIPGATHPDIAALRMLEHVLAARPSGRLYKALVETKRASSVGASAGEQREPGVFSVFASVQLGQDPERVQQRLIELVESVAGTVKADEVERARNSALKNLRLSLTNSRSVALALSESEAIGDWRLLFLARDQTAAVTADDVNRVARTYLIASNRTAGLFRPTAQPERVEVPPAPDAAALLANYSGSAPVAAGEAFEATPENLDRSTLRAKVGDIELALLPKRTRGEIVYGRIRLGYGTEQSLASHVTAASFLPGLLMRGSARLDEQAIRDRLDAIETQLGVGGGLGYLEVSLRTTKAHLPDAIALAGEILRQPSFPAAQLEQMRQQRLTGYEAQRTDPQARLGDVLTRALEPFPPESVHYRPTLDERIERTRVQQRKEIVDLHRRFLGAEHAHASFVGDFEPAELEKALGAAFAGWTAPEPYERILFPYLAIAPLEQTLDTPDKKMAVVSRAIAFRMNADDPDFPALSFANYVLGRGSSSRLFTALRQKAGLSYGASSSLEVPIESESATLVATAITAPQNARRAQALMQQEFQRWLEQPIPNDELATMRAAYTQTYRTELADDGSIASTLLANLRFERTFASRQKRLDEAVQLSAEQIQAALRRHLAELPLVDLAAGDVAKFGAAAEPEKPAPPGNN